MHSSVSKSLAGCLLWAAFTSGTTLFAADSSGNVTTLSLTECGSNDTLTVTSRTAECADNPSWLTLDSDSRVLYCLDRGATNATSGSLNSFSIDEDGSLSRIARMDAPPSGVAGKILTTDTGARGYVTASYNETAASVFALGANGTLPEAEPLQVIHPTVDQTGPIPDRQDRSYLHHVILDPENRYIVIPDLGADKVRVFSYDQEAVAPITEVDGLTADPGTGPRHGFFREASDGSLYFFFNGELSQKVFSYRVAYTETGLAFTKVFEIPALDAGLPANRAPTSEIALSPDRRFLVVSNREKSFSDSPIAGSGPSDTLSTFSINEDGTLELAQLAPSGGWLPRHFTFNKAGDRIAVGHQTNRTVVIWKRDIESGNIIPEEDGGKVGQVTLDGPVVATIWDE